MDAFESPCPVGELACQSSFVNCCRQDDGRRAETLASWRLLTASGTCLALHFGLWVYSLENTSLTHSLLLVCSTPVLLALGTWALRKPISRVSDRAET
jgi:drug/metabolite transporter (DMT)-like permease